MYLKSTFPIDYNLFMPAPHIFPSKVGCFIKWKLNIVKGCLIEGKQYSKALLLTSEEYIMWIKPNFEEMRLGFEVTLYISNR